MATLSRATADDAVATAGVEGAVVRGGGVSTPRRSSRVGDGPGSRWWTPYGFLLPAFVLYAAFLLYPILRALQFSFYDWDGISLAKFAGFKNYQKVFTDPQLLSAFGHALVLIVFYGVIPLIIGLVLAAILNRAKVRGLGFFRTVVFLPQVIAMVVVAVAWNVIYSPTAGLNSALRAVGLQNLTHDWLGDYSLALPSVGFIGTWVCMGLVTVLLLAGMSRISVEQYEAARLDGAGPFREFFSITLPSVRGEIAVALTLTIIAALKTFDLVFVMTSGGPGTQTTVPSYEVYRNAFKLHQVGLATAIGITLTVIIFLINLAVNRIGDKAE